MLCDKYDTVKLVRLWLERWLADSSYLALKDGQEVWLFGAWTFGREEIFNQLVRRLIRRRKPSLTHLHLPCGTALGGYMLPGIIGMRSCLHYAIVSMTCQLSNKEHIENASKGLLESPLKVCDHCVSRYSHKPQPPTICRVLNFNHGRQELIPTWLSQKYGRQYDALVLGSLIQGLASYGPWPIPESLNRSADTLSRQINELDCYVPSNSDFPNSSEIVADS